MSALLGPTFYVVGLLFCMVLTINILTFFLAKYYNNSAADKRTLQKCTLSLSVPKSSSELCSMDFALGSRYTALAPRLINKNRLKGSPINSCWCARTLKYRAPA